LTLKRNSLYYGLMKKAKLFKNGQSQAVRLPKEFRFKGESVLIQHVGECVVLLPCDTDPWKAMFEEAKRFTSDFMNVREQGDQPEREEFA